MSASPLPLPPSNALPGVLTAPPDGRLPLVVATTPGTTGVLEPLLPSDDDRTEKALERGSAVVDMGRRRPGMISPPACAAAADVDTGGGACGCTRLMLALRDIMSGVGSRGNGTGAAQRSASLSLPRAEPVVKGPR